MKRLLQWLFPKRKPYPLTRPKPDSKTCPICGSIGIMIYDQEHDCCFTCNSKWSIEG